MECWTTGMKTLWILVAGPWSPAHLKTLSLACEFVFFNTLVLLLTQWIWLHRFKLHFCFWVLQGGSKPISFWHFIWGRRKSHKSSTSVRDTEHIWLFTPPFPLISAWLTRKGKWHSLSQFYFCFAFWKSERTNCTRPGSWIRHSFIGSVFSFSPATK